MALVYFGKMVTPSIDIEKLPPSVTSSTWFTNVIAIIQAEGVFHQGWEDGYIQMTFDTTAELESWVTTHALTDETLINEVKTWNATYGVRHVHEIHHDDSTVESTTLALIPLG
jgi:hypothetical protein